MIDLYPQPYIPHELALSELYFPPFLVAAFYALLLTWGIVKLLNHYRFARFFYRPALIFISFFSILTCAIGTYVIPF